MRLVLEGLAPTGKHSDQSKCAVAQNASRLMSPQKKKLAALPSLLLHVNDVQAASYSTTHEAMFTLNHGCYRLTDSVQSVSSSCDGCDHSLADIFVRCIVASQRLPAAVAEFLSSASLKRNFSICM